MGMASAGRRACLYRLAHPLPLGAGEYVRPAGIGSVCGEGVGVSSWCPLSLGSASCPLVISVVLVLVIPACFVILFLSFSSSLPAPCLLRRHVSSSSSFSSSSPSHPLCASVLALVFLCGFLSFFSPFLRLAGRGDICLLASCRLVSPRAPALPLVSSCPRACLPRSVSPSRSCDRLLPPAPSSCSCLVAPCSFVLPVLRQAWTGSVSARSLLACPRSPSCGRRGGVGWIAAARRAYSFGGSVSAARCVRFVVSVFVYMNWVLARVS